MQLVLDHEDVVAALGESRAADVCDDEQGAHLSTKTIERRAAVMETIVSTLRSIIPDAATIDHVDLQVELSGKIVGAGVSGTVTMRISW
jgi:hypothetical protein